MKEKQTTKTFKPYISKVKKSYFQTEHVYICTCDLEQKSTKDIGGIKIQTMNHYNSDHRDIHPTIGTIVSASDNSQFKVGQDIICKHFTFEDGQRNSKEFYTCPITRTKYFKVLNRDVMFGIDGDELEPRTGVLLCEGVDGKFTDTSIELDESNSGRRRDIVKVLKTWKGSTDVKEGEYVMLKYGGDYPFDFNGKTYLKVDYDFGDCYFKTDSKDWYDSVISKHVKHGE